MKLFLLFVFLLSQSQNITSDTELSKALLSAAEGSRQSTTQESKQAGNGLINGRIISNTGEILAYIEVTISRVKKDGQQDKYTTGTDSTGRFQFKGIPQATYSMAVRAPGFVRIFNPVESSFCRAGDFITITMAKGGVIAGTVKSPSGEPLIHVPVRALRTSNLEGKVRAMGVRPRERLTDDKGEYRLYGLEPGIYVVSAGGGGQPAVNFNKYQENAPTYYPSSTVDTATELRVDSGQEITGIDIHYRDFNGQTLSGTISGSSGSFSYPNISVTLIQAKNGSVAAVTSAQANTGFAFYGVPDGEYMLIAQTYSSVIEKDAAISQSLQIKVKGSDITGLKLLMKPLSSVSGRLFLETPTTPNFKQCETEKITTLKDVLILLQREKARDDEPKSWDLLKSIGVADEEGNFRLVRLIAGQYQLQAYLPNDKWFIQSISQPADKKKDTKSSAMNVAADLSITGISLQSGERVDNLSFIFSEGAAAFQGRLLAQEPKAKLDNLLVYLLPDDKALANNALRFYHSFLQEKGEFSFSNLAPGKYWVVAKRLNDDEMNDPALYRTKAGRASLLKEAEAFKLNIDLQPCQRIMNHTLRFTLNR
jgi:hypothetical protein